MRGQTKTTINTTGVQVERSMNRDIGSQGFATDTDAMTYAATVTPNAALGQYHTVSPNTNGAFTIAAPSNDALLEDVRIIINIKNTTGGALGAVTWNAIYKIPAGGPTLPGATSQRSYEFVCDGTNYILVSFTASDVAL